MESDDIKYNKKFMQLWGIQMIERILCMGAVTYQTGETQTLTKHFEFDNPWGLDIGMDFTITCEKPKE